MGGLYYWGPKITGYLLNERIGKIQFWFLFIGTQVFTFPQYLLGPATGMPRRIAVYPHDPQWKIAERLELGRRALDRHLHAPLRRQRRRAAGRSTRRATTRGTRQTLEWFTTSPPPHHNFYRLPQIRSERPTWDYNHPEHRSLAHGTHVPHGTTEVPVAMKVEAKLLLGLGVFFGVMCAVYWNWSLENAGGVMMFAGMLLGFLPGGYYYWWSRRMKARPEDDPQRDPGRRAPAWSAPFPGTSIWPFTLGMGAFFVRAGAGLRHLAAGPRPRPRRLGRCSAAPPRADGVARSEQPAGTESRCVIASRGSRPPLPTSRRQPCAAVAMSRSKHFHHLASRAEWGFRPPFSISSGSNAA